MDIHTTSGNPLHVNFADTEKLFNDAIDLMVSISPEERQHAEGAVKGIAMHVITDGMLDPDGFATSVMTNAVGDVTKTFIGVAILAQRCRVMRDGDPGPDQYIRNAISSLGDAHRKVGAAFDALRVLLDEKRPIEAPTPDNG